MSTSVDQLLHPPSPSAESTCPSQINGTQGSFEGFVTLYNRPSSRIRKSYKPTKRSFDTSTRSRLLEHLKDDPATSAEQSLPSSNRSGMVTLLVGPRQRKFAAHEQILSSSPFFASACDGIFVGPSRRIALGDEEPEVISLVLEYLYKGDYAPRLLHDKKRSITVLEGVDGLSLAHDGPDHTSGTVFSHSMGDQILRDAAVYCSADRYGLDDLKSLALRKLRLVTGVDAAVMLRSARFVYERVPEVDAPLKAFFLSTFIRHRKVFAESKAMRVEMEAGGRLFLDLFVAMARHIDALSGKCWLQARSGRNLSQVATNLVDQNDNRRLPVLSCHTAPANNFQYPLVIRFCVSESIDLVHDLSFTHAAHLSKHALTSDTHPYLTSVDHFVTLNRASPCSVLAIAYAYAVVVGSSLDLPIEGSSEPLIISKGKGGRTCSYEVHHVTDSKLLTL